MLTLFFVLQTLLFSLGAQAQLLPPPAPGEYQLHGEFSYFSTTANFGGDSAKATLSNGTSLSTMNGFGEFIFDWTTELRLRASLTGGQTSANRLPALNKAPEVHTNAGISEAGAGAEYWYHFLSFDLVPDLEFYYPFFRVDMQSGDPLLGEGATRLRGGSWLIGQWGDFRPFGYLGYEFRDEGRSTLMPYHIGLQWLTEGGWWIQGEMRGYQSLTSDTNTNSGVVRTAYLNDVQGGSERFYSLNPSSNEVAAMVGTHLGQFGIYLGGAYTVMGKNSADGYTVYTGVTFDGSFYMPTPQPVTRSTYVNRFKVKPDRYDDSLFNSNPVPGSPAPVPVPETGPAVAPAPPVRSRVRPLAKPAAKKGPMPTVELLMKDTENALEKKGKGE